MAEELGFPKLNRQPLSLVLADFRFSPIAKMGNWIPDIQEKLRKDFPSFQEVQGQQIILGSDIPKVLNSSLAWTFTGPGAQKSIRIEQSRLVYVTTSYGRFPGFRGECVKALRLLKNVVDPGLLTRVGLRYNDIIVPQPDEDFEKYLVPNLLPLMQENIEIAQHRCETLARTEFGMLAVRTFMSRQGIVIMPDLHDVPLKLRSDAPKERLSVILDIDHYRTFEGGVSFTIEEAAETLSSLHRIARSAFWKATTNFARNERWS